ncbi:MAG: hypothetical protein AMQ74_00187 [Candidatus Methanofastidiosum methylothiophilum]|uniref:Uncharacterized protein n=1 Tax=Candidatus Methanofastidiosum methylothiophilum TaxID=1705564 RepID=A0A150J9W8_9EURY|nr:MAG: hypothetical protein AMQ74_00187 [Candidatus Methanofastidiosum methylthiophilus]NMC76774.1 hypothetical protein [Candidatus Methanofastidiosa archaeon]
MCNHKNYVVLNKRGRQELRKCSDCNEIYQIVVDKVVKIKINAVISRFEQSEKKLIEAYENKVFEVGELIDIKGKKYLVNHIDAKIKSDSVIAKDIQTLYLIPEDLPVVLKITLKDQSGFLSFRAFAEKDEVFSKGDNITIDRYDMIIEKILGAHGYESSAVASDIRRIYCSYASKRGRRLDGFDY